MQPGATLLDRYRLEHELGRGAYGVVFRAVRLSDRAAVAIKVMDTRQLGDRSAIERFRLEARTAARIQHPHAVRMLDAGDVGDEAFLVMELLEGRTLAALIEERSRLPDQQVLAIMRDVASALHAAHAANVIHRDIKPENVFLQRVEDREIVKVLDFGVAKATDDVVQTLTMTGAVVGTPLYIAPERLRGEPFDGRSDVFALGVTMYRCLSGERPFSRDSNELIDVVLSVMNDAPKPLLEIAPATNPGLAAIITAAMEKNPEQRPSAAEVIGQLDRIKL